LNDEVNVAVFSRRLATRFLQDFENDLRVSQRWTLESWRERPYTDRVHEYFWSFFGEVF
jgi:cardiolipin synthase